MKTKRTSMLEIKAVDLSPAQIQAIKDLLFAVDPSLPEDYLESHHLEQYHDFDNQFFLFYQGEELVGVVSYISFMNFTPFQKEPAKIILGGMTYKKRGLKVKRMTLRAGLKQVRLQLGRFWFLKSFLMLAPTVNPRLMLTMERVFPKVYPGRQGPVPRALVNHLNHLLKDITPPDYHLNAYLIEEGDARFPARTEITTTYQSLYETADPALNTFFFHHGIYEQEQGKIYLTNKSVLFAAWYHPSKAIPHMLKQLFRRGRGRRVARPEAGRLSGVVAM